MTEKLAEKEKREVSANRISLREAWKMSKLPYVEVLYKSNQLASGTSSPALVGTNEEDSKKRIKSILRGAKVSKSVFTLFVCLGTAVPFIGFATSSSPISLVSAIAISLMIGFAYLIFYSLQILPSLSGAEPYSLLLTLPYSKRDFSLVSMFSFFRTLDYLAIGSIIVPFAAVAVLTRSIPASALMLGASTINVIFAVVVGLWISRLFYKNITRGGRSKGATLSRIVFLITWGFAVLSTGFLFQIVTYLLPYVNQIFSGSFYEGFGVILSLLHPFTFGLAVASLAFPALFGSSVSGSSAVTLFSALSYAATIAYFLVAFVAVRRTSNLLTSITHGQGVAIAREIAKEFTLKLRKPFSAYMMKDLRGASKNPSTAFLFALPLFEAIVIYIALNESGAVNMTDVASMTMIGALLTSMAGVMLLNTERKGLEYTLSLPLSWRMIVDAKSLIATLTFVPVPFVILVLQFAQSGASISSLFPFIEIFAVSAAITAEIAVLISGHSGTSKLNKNLGSSVRPARSSSMSLQSSGFSMISGTNLGRMIKAVLIALLIMSVPVASYFVILSYYGIGLVSILVMTLVAALEFVIVQVSVRLKR